MKIGVLLHVYNLQTDGWEDMVWGRPERDELGLLAKFAECLLDIPAEAQVMSLIFDGVSQRDGLHEGAYTKKFLMEHLDGLHAFPRLQSKLDGISDADRKVFMQRLRALEVGPMVRNTLHEIESGASYFTDHPVDRVLHVAAPTQAPRCLRDQLKLKHQGGIPLSQVWTIVPAEVHFAGRTPHDIVIAEPTSRPDNPFYHYYPSWVDVTKRYSYLSLENKKTLLAEMDQLMARLLSEQPADTPMAN